MDHQKIQYFLQNIGADYIIWHRNPPASSHKRGVWERQIQSARIILLSLLNTHGRSLNDESLRTFLAETEAILNSRSLIVDILGDVQSQQQLCPSNTLTMKYSIVFPPSGQFVNTDEFSRRRWRHFHSIANFQQGNIMLLKTEANRNQWPMAKVTVVNADDLGFLRSFRLLLASSCDSAGERVLELPIHKIVLIKEVEV